MAKTMATISNGTMKTPMTITHITECGLNVNGLTTPPIPSTHDCQYSGLGQDHRDSLHHFRQSTVKRQIPSATIVSVLIPSF
jgi:hypothetical protein